VIVFAASMVLVKWSRHDDRAYSVDSGDLTLEEGLSRAKIILPDCLMSRLKYALVDNGFGYYYDIYLALESAPDCMERLIKANQLYGFVSQQLRLEGASQDQKLIYRDSWLDKDEVSDMGWDVGPDQAFQEFVGATTPKERVQLLVRHTPDPEVVQAYLYASHGG
jgi:hypothetical protein